MYFSKTDQNDFMFIVDVVHNWTRTFSLSCSNCKIAISPDRAKALVWDNTSKVFIFDPNENFVNRYNFTQSVNAAADSRTDSISLSSDGSMAILETDEIHPIRIINLSTYTTIANITVSERVLSTSFVDPQNRFILIRTATQSILYDLQTSASGTSSENLNVRSLFGDSSVSELFTLSS
jgi:hypothetical protein